MDRPALRQLLADIRARRVDTVVVYKVDRLARSLTDFAKIVEVFDARGVSFVSVTQQFNTTTSMGRLTLNMLLSFAQFEREVTGERDCEIGHQRKCAASRGQGLETSFSRSRSRGGPVQRPANCRRSYRGFESRSLFLRHQRLAGGGGGIRTHDTAHTVYTLSRRAPSTTRPPLRGGGTQFSGPARRQTVSEVENRCNAEPPLASAFRAFQ